MLRKCGEWTILSKLFPYKCITWKTLSKDCQKNSFWCTWAYLYACSQYFIYMYGDDICCIIALLAVQRLLIAVPRKRKKKSKKQKVSFLNFIYLFILLVDACVCLRVMRLMRLWIECSAEPDRNGKGKF